MEAGDGLRFFFEEEMILKNNIIPLGEPVRNDPVPYFANKTTFDCFGVG